jgi:phosphoglycolate phosphatase-like HAD superfamily hydrolase
LRSAVTFDLDGTLVDLRSVYVRANQVAALEVLGRKLEEARVLELMETGMPIRAHMALLDEPYADRLVDVFVEHYRETRSCSRSLECPSLLAAYVRLVSGLPW